MAARNREGVQNLDTLHLEPHDRDLFRRGMIAPDDNQTAGPRQGLVRPFRHRNRAAPRE